MAATWQDRWGVPGAAMAVAAFAVYTYAFDSGSRPGTPLKITVPITEPRPVVVDRNLRDPIMIGNEWDAVLVNRNKAIAERKAAAEEAREEERRKQQEQEDEDYFKRTGKRRLREPKAKKGGLAGDTENVTGTRKPRAPAPPPAPPAFKVRGVVISGSTRTAVVNEKTVTIGDVVQGFRVEDLTLDVIHLVGTVAPWKDKKLQIDTRPPPQGIRFLSEDAARQLAATRGKLFRPPTGGSPRPVMVLPTIIGEPEAPEPSAPPTPAPAPTGPPPDNRPWWQRLTGEGAKPSPAPSAAQQPWWSGFGRPNHESHPLEDKPRTDGGK